MVNLLLARKAGLFRASKCAKSKHHSMRQLRMIFGKKA
ncbi:hypothetical protein BBD26_0480 [Lactobacillus delbrueckii subsp. bulgaricus]|nr:hypothetical protein BBD26_0480 [Lactobacillus delbrueckii subsp. bulgaricus]